VAEGAALKGAAAPRNLGRWAMFGGALVGWLACFAVLRRLGTWTPFALVGPVLAVLAITMDAKARPLLTPSFQKVGVGVTAGLCMAALTHGGLSVVEKVFPRISTDTVRLFELMNVGSFSPGARAALIVLIASSEEVIFRGALLVTSIERGGGTFHRVDVPALRTIIVLALFYAAATTTLGSALLVLTAFGCAVVWGWLRVATRSLVAPILAHLVWDMGVLVLWPLVRLPTT
jgi:membrane protease YdiL (CAAX protease family)